MVKMIILCIKANVHQQSGKAAAATHHFPLHLIRNLIVFFYVFWCNSLWKASATTWGIWAPPPPPFIVFCLLFCRQIWAPIILSAGATAVGISSLLRWQKSLLRWRALVQMEEKLFYSVHNPAPSSSSTLQYHQPPHTSHDTVCTL